jgi:hypothetical protein
MQAKQGTFHACDVCQERALYAWQLPVCVVIIRWVWIACMPKLQGSPSNACAAVYVVPAATHVQHDP